MATDTKFTPAPWRVEGRSNGWPLISHGINEHRDGPAGYVGILQQASDADAKLIAAAPEMFRLLDRLGVHLRHDHAVITCDGEPLIRIDADEHCAADWLLAWGKTRDALLAKARGEAA